MTKGDVILLQPSSSKCDQFGLRWCPFPSVLPFDGTGTCAAAAVRDILLESLHIEGEARERTALFRDENGSPFTYGILNRELNQLCKSLFGANIASTLSWHSIRIGLACALSSAGCPDAHIQLICRWACEESLRAYRQLGVEQNVAYTDAALRAVFDATRVNNLPMLDDPRYGVLASGRPLTIPTVSAVLPDTPPPAPPRRACKQFDIGTGTVSAFTDGDALGLTGRQVDVPNDFWAGWARYSSPSRAKPGASRTLLTSRCDIVGECERHFAHPDGIRCHTYLISFDECAYPIKAASLRSLHMSTA